MTKTKYLGETPVTDLAGTPYEGFGAVEWALDFIYADGQIDGEHHKMWTLDQAARILTGSPVIVTLASWDNGHSEHRTEVGEPTDVYRAWVENWNAGRRSIRPGDGTTPAWLALEFMLVHGRSVDAEGDVLKLDIRTSNLKLYHYAQHKQWMLDRVARILHGTEVLSLDTFELGEPTQAYLDWVDDRLGDEDEDGEREYGYEIGEPLKNLASVPRGAYDDGVAP